MNRPRRTTVATAGAVVLATSGGLLAAVSPASAAVTCASPVFKRTFYANTTFSGTPKATDCDSVIDQNWGTGAPGFKGMPANNFGVRWSTTRDFGSGGPFTFTASSRDGIRVYLDGVRKVDLWKNVATTVSKTVNVTIPSGKHSLRVDFVNWTGAANVKFAYAPRTSATVDKVKPLVPTGTTVTYSTATTSTKVSWAKNKEMDLAGYRVYRRLKGTSYPAKPIATTTATSYTDTTVPKDGNVYYYEVRAYDKAGNVSTGSTDQPVTTIAVTAPAGLTAQGTDAAIVLSWQPVPGAVRYNLKSDGQTVRSVTATSFSDTTVKRSEKRTYQVAAVDGAGRTSAYSSTVTAYRPVAAPKDIVATPGISRVTFTWTTDHAVDGNVYDFHVYRSETLPVDTSADPVRCTTSWKSLGDGRLQYTCTDTSPAAWSFVPLRLQGVRQRGQGVTAFRDRRRDHARAGHHTPAAVTGLATEATEYGIELHWNANTEPDLKRYVVYVGELIDSEDERVCYGVSSVSLGAGTTSYTDERLPDGEERCYFVDVEDTSGNSSFRATHDAEIAVVTERDLTPSVETPDNASLTLTALKGATGTSVDLSWNTVADATGYLVERWNPATDAYEQLTTGPVTEVSYTDATARPTPPTSTG